MHTYHPIRHPPLRLSVVVAALSPLRDLFDLKDM